MSNMTQNRDRQIERGSQGIDKREDTKIPSCGVDGKAREKTKENKRKEKEKRELD